MINAKHEERVLEKLPRALAASQQFLNKGELDLAIKEAGDYLTDHFDNIDSLMLCANILIEAGRLGMAHSLLMRAAQLEPNVPTVWNNIGVCYREGSDLEQAETHFHRALKLDAEDGLAHMNLAQLYVNMTQPMLALKHANKAIEIDPSLAEAFYNRSLANISLENFKEGWADYDSILGNAKIRKERVYGFIPRWNGTQDKTIIAYGEQGIGDEVAFASCIPDLAKNNKVILECNPRLRGLFKRSFDLETYGTRFDEMVYWLNEKSGSIRKIDGAVAFGSLPQFYRNEVKDFPGTPYLIADPLRRIQWKAALASLGTKLKVGIAWTGGKKGTGLARRSLDLDDLLPILRQDATFISLQYMDSAREVRQLERDHGVVIHHWPHAVETQDMDDTASLIAELDLVITVQTAAVHLSGALGQKCWAMLPKNPRWFYGISGSTMPWYESVKLYRQKFKWVDLVSEVATDLRNLINPPIKSVY